MIFKEGNLVWVHLRKERFPHLRKSKFFPRTNGHAVNRSPLFKGYNYDHWKQRMIAFFDACYIELWDILENGNYIPS
ncbi:hypothetical protein CR513_18628, partial [Mucuna pruriens]